MDNTAQLFEHIKQTGNIDFDDILLCYNNSNNRLLDDLFKYCLDNKYIFTKDQFILLFNREIDNYPYDRRSVLFMILDYGFLLDDELLYILTKNSIYIDEKYITNVTISEKTYEQLFYFHCRFIFYKFYSVYKFNFTQHHFNYLICTSLRYNYDEFVTNYIDLLEIVNTNMIPPSYDTLVMIIIYISNYSHAGSLNNYDKLLHYIGHCNPIIDNFILDEINRSHPSYAKMVIEALNL